MTDLDRATIRRERASAGAQVDVRLVTLSHLDSTFSFGFATAWGPGVQPTSALMASFKFM